MTKPSDAAMRAAQLLLEQHVALDGFVPHPDKMREAIAALISPPSDAEREELVRRLRGHTDGVLSHAITLGTTDLMRTRLLIREAAAALSRPAPGWNEACEAIAQACERDCVKIGAGSLSSFGLEQAAAIARGMRKEQ